MADGRTASDAADRDEGTRAAGTKVPGERIVWLDMCRGAALVSMIAYHAVWDAVFLYGYDVPELAGLYGRLWQQLTCSAFILVAGISFGLDRSPWTRGATLVLLGGVVTGMTSVLLPPGIHYGILTLLGASILGSAALRDVTRKIAPGIGMAAALAAFVLTRGVVDGTAGIGAVAAAVPPSWYEWPWSAFLGFAPATFRSLDYFPLLPWFFLFRLGLHVQRAYGHGWRRRTTRRPLAILGRHSLTVYLVHQPLLWWFFVLLSGTLPRFGE